MQDQTGKQPIVDNEKKRRILHSPFYINLRKDR